MVDASLLLRLHRDAMRPPSVTRRVLARLGVAFPLWARIAVAEQRRRRNPTLRLLLAHAATIRPREVCE